MYHVAPMTQLSQRAVREIEHGRKLDAGDPDKTWGWATPAGKIRAPRRAGLIASGAGLGPGVRVLEIGCGSGVFTEMFAATGATIVAVDISGELLRRARARGLPESRVTFLEKPFERCDVDGPFDAVVGSSILHHLDIKRSLIRVHQLLKPGGRISFAEPNMLNPQVFLQKNVPWIKARLGESPDETAFIRFRLRRFLARTGFADIRITPFDWLHPRSPAPLIGFVQTLGILLEKLPLVRELSGSLHICARRPEAAGS
jgi:2-polyprenyl-3-methyl-5-hydroxy-6-metoxy-1,4-benzoquinol methylase